MLNEFSDFSFITYVEKPFKCNIKYVSSTIIHVTQAYIECNHNNCV